MLLKSGTILYLYIAVATRLEEQQLESWARK